jgi:hypothetical protein
MVDNKVDELLKLDVAALVSVELRKHRGNIFLLYRDVQLNHHGLQLIQCEISRLRGVVLYKQLPQQYLILDAFGLLDKLVTNLPQNFLDFFTPDLGVVGLSDAEGLCYDLDKLLVRGSCKTYIFPVGKEVIPGDFKVRVVFKGFPELVDASLKGCKGVLEGVSALQGPRRRVLNAFYRGVSGIFWV